MLYAWTIDGAAAVETLRAELALAKEQARASDAAAEDSGRPLRHVHRRRRLEGEHLDGGEALHVHVGLDALEALEQLFVVRERQTRVQAVEGSEKDVED